MNQNRDNQVPITEIPDDTLASMRDFHDAIRRVLALHGIVQGEAASFDALAAKINAIADELEDMPRGRPFLRFTGLMPHDRLNDSIPFSPITGSYNALALPLKMHIEGDKLVGTGIFNEAYEGPNQCMHGGMVASIYDHVLAEANLVHKMGGPTASLTTYFKKPTPLHVPLRFEGWTEKIDGRKITTRGRCIANGEVITEAEGLFIRLNPEKRPPQWTNQQQSYDR